MGLLLKSGEKYRDCGPKTAEKPHNANASEWLELDNNVIADISPLLENLDLGEGDFVDLRHNQFKDNLAKVHSTVLEGRGVMVLIND